MPFDLSRKRMIEELNRKGITHPRVLQAMGDVPRHLFMEEALRLHAYADKALPICEKQTISRPLTVALMSSILDAQAADRVLELGTGSGYQAAVLARMAAHVYTIERIRSLYEQARRNLKACGIYNVSFRLGDGSEGWPERAPFDRIIVTAASAEPPVHLVSQLTENGRLLSPVRSGNGQRLTLLQRGQDGGVEARDCGPCDFVPLVPGADR